MKAHIDALFDEVVVISLRDATERRRYVASHLADVGISRFSFFDATGPDDPLLEDPGLPVASYPPCFRCGQLDCGSPDCNNVLLAPQIAVNLTYRRLWRRIADGQARSVLVLEDDVKVHDHAPDVLSWLRRQVEAGALPLKSEAPCLIRLGWALGPDHDPGVPPHSGDAVRMANPCHALNPAYARALLERDIGITHTADVYQHRLAPREAEAFTIFPPIASELSWSEGALASSIHPKPIRAEFLRARGDEAGALQADEAVRRHVKKRAFRSILLTGHPRGGTGYGAALCRQLGLDVGHERVGADGVSSWMLAVEADENPWAADELARTRKSLAWRHLIFITRDLASAAPSIMRDSEFAPASYAFRREHILRLLGVDLEDLPTPFERAVRSAAGWARIIVDQEPDLIFSVESGQDDLRHFLIGNGLAQPQAIDIVLDAAPVNADKRYQGVRRPKPVVTMLDWRSLSDESLAEAEWYCQSFGYQRPWEASPP